MKIVCDQSLEGYPKGLLARNISKLLAELYTSINLLSIRCFQPGKFVLKFGCCMAFIFLAFWTNAQVTIQTQPVAVTNCQPIASTSYSLPISIRKGSCGNINTGNVSVVWQFSADNTTWANVGAG